MIKHSVREATLSNGAKGLFIDVPDASVMYFELCFRAGDYLVPREKNEVPHLMEHMLLGANARYHKARNFTAELEKNGASANARTGTYNIVYECECADFEWQRILEHLLLAIDQPLFLRSEYESEYRNVKDELVSRGNNHYTQLILDMSDHMGLRSMTYQNASKQLKNIRYEDIKKHYQRTHLTRNLRFSIAGNLTDERQAQIIKMLEAINLPAGDERFELPEEHPQSLPSVHFIRKNSVPNIYFSLQTFAAGRFNDDDWNAAGLINNMLTETLHSRILGEAREKGLVYSMGSGFSEIRDYANWGIGTQVMAENLEPLLDIVVREVRKVLDGRVVSKDIDAAKQYSIGRYQRQAQTVGGIAGLYNGRYFFEDIINDYTKIDEEIRRVTKRDIVRIMRRFFAQNIWAVGMLGSADAELRQRVHDQLSVLWQK